MVSGSSLLKLKKRRKKALLACLLLRLLFEYFFFEEKMWCTWVVLASLLGVSSSFSVSSRRFGVCRPQRTVLLSSRPLRWPSLRRGQAKEVSAASSLAIRQQLLTLGRVVLPAVAAAALGVGYYDNISKYINVNWLDEGSITFLSSDDIQYLPSFLAVLSLLFSILAGNAYQSLYSQQEDIYFALYREVSDAKSLLEQMALVCRGRPFYLDAIRALQQYVRTDLQRLDVPPAELIARSPSKDPLETIMYLTSVGVPSVVYETVRDLRQSRGQRLGAMQRKFPSLGIVLLYILAILELVAFPLLGAGSAYGVSVPLSILNVQGALFGGLCGATVLVLRIIQELWRTSGGAFNVDAVLAQMVKGLNDDLDRRANLARTDYIDNDQTYLLDPDFHTRTNDDRTRTQRRGPKTTRQKSRIGTAFFDETSTNDDPLEENAMLRARIADLEDNLQTRQQGDNINRQSKKDYALLPARTRQNHPDSSTTRTDEGKKETTPFISQRQINRIAWRLASVGRRLRRFWDLVW